MSLRCPSCSGRGTVGSIKDALRSALGKLRPEDVGGKEQFEIVKKAYLALSVLPKRQQTIDPKASHGIAKEQHLGPRQWLVVCSCGKSTTRGTRTAAKNEILRHVKEST